MKHVIDMTICCTIADPFHVMELARREIEATKPREVWEQYYAKPPTEALQQLIRSGIAAKLHATGAVELHEIGQELRELNIPSEIYRLPGTNRVEMSRDNEPCCIM